MTARMHRRTLLVAAAILTLFMVGQMTLAGNADARRVVLGAHAFAPNGFGFGAAHPKRIFNGGDPNGYVRHVRWSGWGGKVARGRGKGSQFKPSGGYYAKSVRVKLRAANKGRCRPHGPIAYRSLWATMQKYPGGPFMRWFKWSGSKTICRFG